MTTEAGRRYRFGFSLTGFIAVALVLLPNIVWAVVPAAYDLPHATTPVASIIGWVEAVCRVVMIALLVFLVDHDKTPARGRRVIGAVALLCLIGYLALWVAYFSVSATPLLLVMMAVLPSIYFICVALLLTNIPAFVAASVFSVVHTASTIASILHVISPDRVPS